MTIYLILDSFINTFYIVCNFTSIFSDCACLNVTHKGYGNCLKRSSRLGGNLFCVVGRDSNCSDIKQEPTTKVFVSVEACKDWNKSKSHFDCEVYSKFVL